MLVLDPASGRLTGADTGPGRLPEPDEIFAARWRCWTPARASTRPGSPPRHRPRRPARGRERRRHPRAPRPGALPGQPVLGPAGLRAGPVAASRGAAVTLVAANTALPDPAGVTVVPVTSARELRDAVLAAAGDADAVVMAAAVADFRPRDTSQTKIKKGGAAEPTEIALVRNPDVLAELAAEPRRRPGQVVVGFAAETGDAEGDVLAHGRAKLARKGCDLLVVNEVGEAGHPTGSRAPRTPRSSSAPTAARPRCRSAARRRWPRSCGTWSPRGSPRRTAARLVRSPERLPPGRRPTAHPVGALCPVASSPPSPSPRATPTRSPTRSATRSWTRCSRRTRKSRVAVETLITTGQVHVAGEVTTTALRRHPGDRARPGARHRLRLVGEGLRRRLVRRLGLDRRAVARHRPGRRRRLRGAPRPLRRPAGPPGRRRPGPDVRLRLRRHPRADAAADHAGAPARPAAGRRSARTAPCPTCARTARPRSPSSTTATAPVRLDTVVVSSQHASDISLDSMLQPDIAEQVVKPVLDGLDIDDRRTTGCWSTRPAASRSAGRWATPA